MYLLLSRKMNNLAGELNTLARDCMHITFSLGEEHLRSDPRITPGSCRVHNVTESAYVH